MMSQDNKRFKLNTPIILTLINVFLLIMSASIIIAFAYDLLCQGLLVAMYIDDGISLLLFIASVASFIVSCFSLFAPKQIVFDDAALNIKNSPRSKKIELTDIEQIVFLESDISLLGVYTRRGYYGANNLITIVSSEGTYYANLKESSDIPKIIDILDDLGISYSEI